MADTATPSVSFIGKVQVPIAATPCSSFRYSSGSPTAPLAAAAAITLAILPHREVTPRRPSAAPIAETFVPAERDEYLLSAQDLGVVELRPGAPYRLVHCVWADEETFTIAARPENPAYTDTLLSAGEQAYLKALSDAEPRPQH